jgi:hypothetical protein
VCYEWRDNSILFDVVDLALSSNGKPNVIPRLKGVDENLASYEAGCACDLDILSICHEQPEEETGLFTNTKFPCHCEILYGPTVGLCFPRYIYIYYFSFSFV